MTTSLPLQKGPLKIPFKTPVQKIPSHPNLFTNPLYRRGQVTIN